MVFKDDGRGVYLIERNSPMWLWIGSAHLPLEQSMLMAKLKGRKQRCKRCSSIVRLFGIFHRKYNWFYHTNIYTPTLPNKLDELVSDLSELSLTHNIVGIRTPGCYLDLALVESEDGHTNIDSNILGELMANLEGTINED